MMIRRAVLLGLLVIVVSGGGLSAAVDAQTLSAQDLLNPDGTLALGTGISGSVDVSGYQVWLDPERGPVFVPLAATGIGQQGATNPHLKRGTVAPMQAGGAWSPLGTGMNDAVYVLAVSNGAVYAGGYFTTAGGVAANRIAKWTPPAPLKGDVDGDGDVDLIDARLCYQIVLGVITGSPAQREQCDVDNDGDVDMDDATAIAEFIIDMRTTLP